MSDKKSDLDEYIDEQFKDIEFAIAYLNIALKEDDAESFLSSLNQFVKVRGYSLPNEKNPYFKDFIDILDRLGLRLSICSKNAIMSTE